MSRMRIVGGIWRGRTIASPPGVRTRPTTDRTRESLASMVLSSFGLDLSEVWVLDAFAGSGALGLEFLSRGAKGCTFVERNRRAAQLVRDNCRTLGADPASARVVESDIFRFVRSAALPGAPFSLILLDPPYAMAGESVLSLVGLLRVSGQLSDAARVLYEHGREHAGLALGGAQLVGKREHGISVVELWEMGSTDE